MTAIAQNLRRLRQLNGLNQGQLAEEIGISRNAYRAIETGQAQPRQGNLQRMAEALKVSALDLVRENPSLESVRFRCQKTLTAQQRAQKNQIVSDAAIWLQDFNQLEHTLGEKQPNLLGRISRGRKSPRTMASQVRDALDLNHGLPVIDICDVVERAGIKVYLFDSKMEKVFGFSVAEDDGGPAIGVNTRNDISIERRIFTLAHELGHLVLHGKSYGDEVEQEDLDHEKEANVFASHFLMPPEAFDRVWEETRGLHFASRVMKTKRHFLVSYRTVLVRLIEKGVVDDRIWARFYGLYEKQYGKKLTHRVEPFPIEEYMFAGRETISSEPVALNEEDFGEDRLDRLVRDAVEKELISVSRGAEILGMSSMQMRERMDSWGLAR